MFRWLKKSYWRPTYIISIASDYTTIIYDNKIILKELSRVADISGQYICAGYETIDIQSRSKIDVIDPISRNRIKDLDATEFMIKCFLRKIIKCRWIKPTIILSYPTPVSFIEQRAIRTIFYNVANCVKIIDESQLLISKIAKKETLNNIVIISIGYDYTNVIAVNNDNILVEEELSQGYDNIYENIRWQLNQKYNVILGKRSIRSISSELKKQNSIEWIAPHALTALPHKILITGTEFSLMADESLSFYVNEISQIITRFTQDYDITKILIIGSTEIVKNFNNLLVKNINIPCVIIEESLGFAEDTILADNNINKIPTSQIKELSYFSPPTETDNILRAVYITNFESLRNECFNEITIGEVCEVEYIALASSSTSIYLKGYKIPYNSTMFKLYLNAEAYSVHDDWIKFLWDISQPQMPHCKTRLLKFASATKETLEHIVKHSWLNVPIINCDHDFALPKQLQNKISEYSINNENVIDEFQELEIIGIILSLEIKDGELNIKDEVDIDVIRLFSYYHKLPREIDENVNLSNDKKTLLEEACKNYLTEQKVNNPTLDICRDAYLLHQNIDAYRCDSSQMKTSQGEYYAIKTHKLKNLIGIYKELKEL